MRSQETSQSNIIMKNLFYLIFSLILLISCNNHGEKNYEDISKIKKGMHVKTVNSIISNSPKLKEIAFWDNSLIAYYYDSQIGASDDLIVVFNKDSLVVDIKYGD